MELLRNLGRQYYLYTDQAYEEEAFLYGFLHLIIRLIKPSWSEGRMPRLLL